MKNIRLLVGILIVASAGLATGIAVSAQDRYTVAVPGGLAFSEFRGYDGWEVVNISENGGVVAAILGNPAMIKAYKTGYPANGKPFPEGARMAKIHWMPKKNVTAPGAPTVGDKLLNVDFMLKDSKRFADSGGWGYAAFEYDAATDTFRPADEKSSPPQAHDAKCGAACHVIAKNRDFVFTEYPKR